MEQKKNQLKKAEKRELQVLEAKRGLESLYKEIELLIKHPNEVEKRLEKLSNFIREYANKKDDSRFKNLIAFAKYYQFLKTDREEKVLREVRKNQAKNLTWRDFSAEILELYYEEGLSNEAIAKVIKARGVKCNRESIRLFLTNKNKKI